MAFKTKASTVALFFLVFGGELKDQFEKRTEGGPQSEAQSSLSQCCPQNKLGFEKYSQDEPDALEKQREREQKQKDFRKCHRKIEHD